MQLIGRGWLVYDLTKSPLALGLVMFSFATPMAVFALLGGALADRVSKSKLIMVAQIFNAFLSLGLAILVHTGYITFWQLIVFGVLTGTCIAFQVPARQTLIPDIVGEKRVMNAVALNSSVSNLARIAGPAVAGLLIAALGTAFVFYLMAGMYVFSILSLSKVKMTTQQAKRPSSIRVEMFEGVRYVFSSSILMSLVIMSFVANLIGMMAFQGLMPAWSVEALQMNATGLGLLMATMGAGAIVGSLFVASLGGFSRRGLLLIGSSLVWALFLFGFALSNHIYLALILLIVLGFLSATYLSLNQSLTQIYSEPMMRSRTMSMNLLSWGLSPLGVLPISVLAEHIGTPHAIAISAAILFVFALVFGSFNPKFRKLK